MFPLAQCSSPVRRIQTETVYVQIESRSALPARRVSAVNHRARGTTVLKQRRRELVTHVDEHLRLSSEEAGGGGGGLHSDDLQKRRDL